MSKVIVHKVDFEDSNYVRGKEKWKASSLYNYAKIQKYPIQKLPLWAINLADLPVKVDNLYDIIEHASRINNTNLNFPIILDDYGQIADGYHRVCKAILEGREYIKAIRMEEMPACDYIID